MGSQEQPGAASSSQEQPVAAKSSQEAPRTHPGDTQEHPGGTQERPGGSQEHPGGSQEAPRRHPGAAEWTTPWLAKNMNTSCQIGGVGVTLF